MAKSRRSNPDRHSRKADRLPPIAERRPKRRTRSLLTGIVTFNNGAESFSCAVRDFSETGARITVPVGVTFPGRLFLIMVRDRIAHEAVVVWFDKREAGLKFERSLTLGENKDDKLAYLNRLWHGSAPR
jgi:hypothetical protein